MNPVPTELQLVEASPLDSLNNFQLAVSLAWMFFCFVGGNRSSRRKPPHPWIKCWLRLEPEIFSLRGDGINRHTCRRDQPELQSKKVLLLCESIVFSLEESEPCRCGGRTKSTEVWQNIYINLEFKASIQECIISFVQTLNVAHIC